MVDVTPLNIASFGAVGDGKTDDGPAFRAANARLNATGGILELLPTASLIVATADPAKVCLGIEPPPGATITYRGTPGKSSLILKSDTGLATDYRELLRVNGAGIRIEGVTLTRTGPMTAVLVKDYSTTGLRLVDCVLDGATMAWGLGVQGIEIAAVPGGVTRGFRLDGCTVVDCAYGLFMTDASTATLDGFAARDCLFTGNWSDDLGFNAEGGAMRDIKVKRCWFTDNRSVGSAAGGGFAIATANVQHALIRDCHFRRHANEAIHLEDGTWGVIIEDSTFSGCGAKGYAAVNLINGTRRVVIRRNHFDLPASATDQNIGRGIYVTWGGNNFLCTTDVEVLDNTYRMPVNAIAPAIFLDDDSRGGVVQGINTAIL